MNKIAIAFYGFVSVVLCFCAGALFQIWWQVETYSGREWLRDNLISHQAITSGEVIK